MHTAKRNSPFGLFELNLLRRRVKTISSRFWRAKNYVIKNTIVFEITERV